MIAAIEDTRDNIQVAASPIHGRGLFTVRDRRTGDVLYTVRGRSVRHPFDSDYRRGANWIGTGWESWLVPARGNPITFTNHCCNPNAIVSEDLVVVAIEEIQAGAEILIDYATTEVDPFWRMRCRCGAPQCQGQVRSFCFLSDARRARYAPYLPIAFLDAARRIMSS